MGTRRNLYRWARILGDIEAAGKGPRPLAKRLARKRVYRATGRLAQAITRALRLR